MQSYKRLKVLGRGSFATVYLVEVVAERVSAEGCLYYVLKDVDLSNSDEKHRTDALREVDVLKSLSHPNVIRYHEAFFDGLMLGIVMEYADGGDLSAAIARRRTARRRYRERQAVVVFVQLALALKYIHDRRILHRDLKTQNVFMDRAGVAKLGDFGIAKVLDITGRMAVTLIGTPYYLPPEMCIDKPYDFKADVWCLGVVLYEILALEVPFSAPTLAALSIKICTTEPNAVSQSYSGEVRALMARMLSKRPEDRPSCTELVAMPYVCRGIASLLGHTWPRPRQAGVSGSLPNVSSAQALAEPILSEIVAEALSPTSDSVSDQLLTDLLDLAEDELNLDGGNLDRAESGELSIPGPDVRREMSLRHGTLRQMLESVAVDEDLLHELEHELLMD